MFDDRYVFQEAMDIDDLESFYNGVYSKAFQNEDEKESLNADVPKSPPLPYPTRKLKMFNGSTAIEYVIPDEDKEKVLKELYPYEDCPDINERMYDLHEEKNFAVRRFKVIREDDRNYLVSPYYARSGGMVIDWALPDEIIRTHVPKNLKGKELCGTYRIRKNETR